MALATKKEKVTEPEALAVRRPSGVMTQMERDVERMFNEFWRRPFASFWGLDHLWPGRTPIFQMPVMDLYEEKDQVVVKAELPGLSKEDLEIDLSGTTLMIKGEKKKEEEVKEKEFYCAERSYGSFARSIELPAEVKPDQINASFKNGVLEVRLAKTEEAKKKVTKIHID